MDLTYKEMRSLPIRNRALNNSELYFSVLQKVRSWAGTDITDHGRQGPGVRSLWLYLHIVKIVKRDTTTPILTLVSKARTKRRGQKKEKTRTS